MNEEPKKDDSYGDYQDYGLEEYYEDADLQEVLQQDVELRHHDSNDA